MCCRRCKRAKDFHSDFPIFSQGNLFKLVKRSNNKIKRENPTQPRAQLQHSSAQILPQPLLPFQACKPWSFRLWLEALQQLMLDGAAASQIQAFFSLSQVPTDGPVSAKKPKVQQQQQTMQVKSGETFGQLVRARVVVTSPIIIIIIIIIIISLRTSRSASAMGPRATVGG